MNQLTLVLPFALTPPELANDLARAMQTPALSMLLSRNNESAPVVTVAEARLLPHEAWLARAHGAAGPDEAPFAHAVMRGLGLPDREGWWFVVQPVHVQLARTHLTMADPRHLRLEDADSRALFDLVQPYFDEVGKPLLYGSANLWFMRADDWRELRTASPDAAAGENLADWMPDGPTKRDFRKLQNEVQMLWHEHPVNEARQQGGLQPVNSFWLWAGAEDGTAGALSGNGPLFVAGCPEWLETLAPPERRAPTAASMLAQSGDATVMLGDLIAPGKGGDWSPWLMHMQRIEQEWLAPLLEALKSGRLASLKLVLTNRTTLAEFTITKGSLRKFWRKPSLAKLSS
ncbi:hypothetical protein [Pseudoduganella namucuonensis]|uniref:Regulatory protein, RpfE type n=1 Tax=Pseudoduganella namucuonensis TaxID=1035707 RepID=A0A1I7HPM7_9BURK|nr:hypothetical protein [Pseudoduganella namucuonensis]SFU62715.1 hypothetical protein SAMN05216552_100695 [Pseudoduganella namucuonensis]